MTTRLSPAVASMYRAHVRISTSCFSSYVICIIITLVRSRFFACSLRGGGGPVLVWNFGRYGKVDQGGAKPPVLNGHKDAGLSALPLISISFAMQPTPVFAYPPTSSRHGVQPVSSECTRHRILGCINMRLGHSWRWIDQRSVGEFTGCVLFLFLLPTPPQQDPLVKLKGHSKKVRFLEYLAACINHWAIMLELFFYCFSFSGDDAI